MSVRIQLASNFQVVELTYDSWDDVCQEEVASARDLVNSLGAGVVNDVKKPTKKPTVSASSSGAVEGPTEKQIAMLRSFGVREETIACMNKKSAWKLINDRSNEFNG